MFWKVSVLTKMFNKHKNFLKQKLKQNVLGSPKFYHNIPQTLECLRNFPNWCKMFAKFLKYSRMTQEGFQNFPQYFRIFEFSIVTFFQNIRRCFKMVVEYSTNFPRFLKCSKMFESFNIFHNFFLIFIKFIDFWRAF